MNFWEAYQLLNNGRYIRLLDWATTLYLFVDPSTKEIRRSDATSDEYPFTTTELNGRWVEYGLTPVYSR